MARRTRLGLEALERRENPVVTAEMTAPFILTITGTEEGDSAWVQNTGTHDVTVYQGYSGPGGQSTEVGVYSWVNKIVFYGYGGQDHFDNKSDKPLEAYGGSGQDYIYGGVAADVIYGGEDGDYLSGGCGEDKLYGQGGGDILRGDSEADFLYGGDGFDTLYGGLGDDYLSGGDGKDTRVGGLGADTFVVETYFGGILDAPGDFNSDEGDVFVTLRYVSPPPIGVYAPPP